MYMQKGGGSGVGEIFFCCSLSYFYSLGISLFMDLELTFFLLCRLVASSKLFDPLSLTPLVLEIQMCTDMPAMCTTKCLAVVYMDARDPNSGPHAFTPVL